MLSAYVSKGLFFYPFINITPNYSTIFFRCDNYNYSKVHENSKNNLLSNKQFGYLSEVSKTKVRKAINVMLYISDYQKTGIIETKKEFKYKITFITLTLPSKQIHSDSELTKTALHDFLNHLRKHYGLKHYVWKAEKQENGNIHFHITSNIYIHYLNLRELWIKCLKPLGYIDNYQENMKNYHINGFKLNEKLLSHWTVEQQISAYKYGVKTNWLNPNCTDIHSVKNIKNLAGYISEYFTKQPLSELELEEYKNAINSIRQAERFIKIHQTTLKSDNNITENYKNQIIEVINSNKLVISEQSKIIEKYSHLFVSGRVWFLSRSLSNVNITIDLDNSIFAEELDNYIKSHPAKIKHNDKFSIILADVLQLKNNNCTNLYNHFNAEIKRQTSI